MIEFALKLPMVGLVWTILTKNQKEKTSVSKVSKNDIFTILAAILDL